MFADSRNRGGGNIARLKTYMYILYIIDCSGDLSHLKILLIRKHVKQKQKKYSFLIEKFRYSLIDGVNCQERLIIMILRCYPTKDGVIN